MGAVTLFEGHESKFIILYPRELGSILLQYYRNLLKITNYKKKD